MGNFNTFSNFSKLVIVFIITTLFSGSALAVATSDSGGGEKNYVGLGGPLVVNILSKNHIHFLQVTTEFKLKDPSMAEQVQFHMAPIKHNLIMLLTEKKFFELQSVQGKRKLREEALEIVQSVLKEKTGDTIVENIFFTSLVLQ